MLQFLRSALPWVLAGALFTGGWHLGVNHERSNWKEVVHEQYITQREATQSTQREVSRVSKEYQEEIAALEGSTDRMLADINSSNKRLRVQVRNLTGRAADNGRCEFTGRAELDETTSRRLIGITQKGDAQIKALIKTVKELQGGHYERTADGS